MSKTQQIINKVYAQLGLSKPVDTFFADIAKNDIQKILDAQNNQKNTPANNLYEVAGFKAQNITSRMVQNQIAYGGL